MQPEIDSVTEKLKFTPYLTLHCISTRMTRQGESSPLSKFCGRCSTSCCYIPFCTKSLGVSHCKRRCVSLSSARTKNRTLTIDDRPSIPDNKAKLFGYWYFMGHFGLPHRQASRKRTGFPHHPACRLPVMLQTIPIRRSHFSICLAVCLSIELNPKLKVCLKCASLSILFGLPVIAAVNTH